MRKKLSRIREGNKILCNKCKTKSYKTIKGHPKEKYGCIIIHKKDCAYLKKLLKNNVEV